MLMYSTMKRVMAVLLTFSMLTTYSLPAYSGMVTTEQLLQQQSVMTREQHRLLEELQELLWIVLNRR